MPLTSAPKFRLLTQKLYSGEVIYKTINCNNEFIFEGVLPKYALILNEPTNAEITVTKERVLE